jgi:hypothetical protein
MTARGWILVGLAVLAGALLWLLVGGVQDGRFIRLERQGPADNMQDYVSGTMPQVAAVTATAVLEAPRFVGQDLTGQNWQIKAARATQTGALENSSVLLEEVQARWENAGAEPVTAAAAQAVYRQQIGVLELNRAVEVTGMGLTLRAPSLTVVVVSRTAVAEGGVQVSGMVGGFDVTVTGARLLADLPAELLTLRGNVKARLVPQ